MKQLKLMAMLTLGFFIALFFSIGVQAQGYGDRTKMGGDGNFSVNGKVILPNGRPAPNVNLTLSNQDFKNYTGATDKDGNFHFGSLAAGNYTVTVKGTEDYDAESETVIIGREASSGQTFTAVIYLRPSARVKEMTGVLSVLLAGVPKDAVKQYENAEKSISDNKLDEALLSLNEAIRLHPAFALAHNEKGLLLFKQNKIDLALESYKEALKIKPDYFDPKLNAGWALIAKNEFKTAERVLLAAISEKNDVPKAHAYLGIALAKQNRDDEAEAALKYAIGLKGGDSLALAHKYLGGIYWQKKKYKEAASELQKYLELSPKAPDADKIKSTIEEMKKKAS